MKNAVKFMNKQAQQRILFIMPVVMLLTAFFYTDFPGLVDGLLKGIIWNNRLVSDSFVVMGIGPTLFNAGIIGILAAGVICYLDMKPNGLIFAAVTLMIGFAFIGKNVVNIIPVFVGGMLYAKFKEVPFKSLIVSTMLATTIAPLISSLFYIHDNLLVSVVIAIIVGIGFGFFLPAISTQVILAHHGYSLYNMGFAAGLTAMVFYGILKSIGKIYDGNMLILQSFPPGIFIMFLVIFMIYVIIGFIENNHSFSGLIEMSKNSGKLVSDFTRICGFPVSLLNIGLLGMFSLGIIFFTKSLNGAVICGLLSVVGFGGFGKHLKNTIPIQIGVCIASYFLVRDVPMSLIVMTAFLATSLAPISGEFGIGFGILAGILHMFFVWNISALHGGINLYNNGLSAGILAMVLIPCIQLLKGELE